jgi:hypothetical protein
MKPARSLALKSQAHALSLSLYELLNQGNNFAGSTRQPRGTFFYNDVFYVESTCLLMIPPLIF